MRRKKKRKSSQLEKLYMSLFKTILFDTMKERFKLTCGSDFDSTLHCPGIKAHPVLLQAFFS